MRSRRAAPSRGPERGSVSRSNLRLSGRRHSLPTCSESQRDSITPRRGPGFLTLARDSGAIISGRYKACPADARIMREKCRRVSGHQFSLHGSASRLSSETATSAWKSTDPLAANVESKVPTRLPRRQHGEPASPSRCPSVHSAGWIQRQPCSSASTESICHKIPSHGRGAAHDFGMNLGTSFCRGESPPCVTTEALTGARLCEPQRVRPLLVLELTE